MPSSFIKDPADVLDYKVDWAGSSPGPWLTEGDTIVTSTWTVPTGITKDSDSHDDGTATVWVSGGTAGTDYRLTNRIVTAGGRTAERTIRIQVRDK